MTRDCFARKALLAVRDFPTSEAGCRAWFDPSFALSGHRPCLIGGIITLDDTFYTTKVTVHSGVNALAPFGCVAFFDSGSPQTSSGARRVGLHTHGGSHIRRVRSEIRSSILGWFWGIGPSTNVDERPPERPIFSSR